MVTEVYCKGTYHIIKIKEILHLKSNIEPLLDIVEDLLKQNKLNIAFCFCPNSYLYSKTGAIIVQCWEKIKDKNGTLALINTNRDIQDFLKVIDIHCLIKLVQSEDDLL